MIFGLEEVKLKPAKEFHLLGIEERVFLRSLRLHYTSERKPDKRKTRRRSERELALLRQNLKVAMDSKNVTWEDLSTDSKNRRDPKSKGTITRKAIGDFFHGGGIRDSTLRAILEDASNHIGRELTFANCAVEDFDFEKLPLKNPPSR
jgi:hypothetical protein